jgi:alkylhydroperoxidase/carboxymuconolactone decarboxylase family protein
MVFYRQKQGRFVTSALFWIRRGEELMETYYRPEDLSKFSEIGKEAPVLAQKFFDYYQSVFAEGALTEREKALIALAVAHAVQCPYCIDAYTQTCLEKGSDLNEMTEAVHVAVAIRGGASLVHGVQMRSVAEKISM